VAGDRGSTASTKELKQMAPLSDGFERSFTIAIRQTSARYWQDTLRLCLHRVEEGQKMLVPFDIEERDLQTVVHRAAASSSHAADVHFSLVAIRNTLRLMEDKLKVFPDAPLQALAEEFRTSFPDAWDLRDILEHLLDYEEGKGKLQRRGEMPIGESIPNLVYKSDRNPAAEVVLLFNAETRNIRVKEALRKAMEIAGRLSELERGEGVQESG
jgi:hypothetical protein